MISIVLLAGILITVLTAIPVVSQMRHHPKGLYVCFFAEMWERFSYYGMRALLIYYLTQHFLFSDDRATDQYAAYTTLVYLLPLIGGLVADRWIGTRKAILFGGVLLVLGHFGMAFEGQPAQQTLTYQGHSYDFVTEGREHARQVHLKLGGTLYNYTATASGGLEFDGLPSGGPLPRVLPAGSFTLGVRQPTPWNQNILYLALSLIIMGVGFMKPNISTIVGQLYGARDPRRDSGFQLYYYGINLGSFWAAILCGALGQSIGWWAGFGLAGVGMLAGLLCFTLGKGWLQGRGEAPDPVALDRKVAGIISKEKLIYGLAVIGIPVIYFMVQRNNLVGDALGAAFVAILAYVVFRMVTTFSRIENFRLGLAMVLTASSVVFWTLFEQGGSSLNLFAERNIDLDILPHPVLFSVFGRAVALASQDQLAVLGALPGGCVWIDTGLRASDTQSFGSGFILLFAPAFAALFTWLARRGQDPDPVKKFAFALVNAGGGFLLLFYAGGMVDSAFKLPVLFLLLTYMLHTIGELSLSPVGLSQQTKLSPPLLISTMMAIWFLGTSGAQHLAGMIAKLNASATVGGKVLDAHAALVKSLATFQTIGWWGVGLGVALFVLSFFIKNWAHGVNDPAPIAEESQR
jgi:POT family proton-dependent oligopeptide transporter